MDREHASKHVEIRNAYFAHTRYWKPILFRCITLIGVAKVFFFFCFQKKSGKLIRFCFLSASKNHGHSLLKMGSFSCYYNCLSNQLFLRIKRNHLLLIHLPLQNFLEFSITVFYWQFENGTKPNESYENVKQLKKYVKKSSLCVCKQRKKNGIFYFLID